MIYLDNAATTIHKPDCVRQAVMEALDSFGNSSRGTHGGALMASRMIYDTRVRVSELFTCSPDHVIFTANSTEALNIAIHGLFSSEDHIITTDLEHNSVLRPLYRLEDAGAALSFVPADAKGLIQYEDFESLILTGYPGHCMHARIEPDRKFNRSCARGSNCEAPWNSLCRGCLSDGGNISG